MIDDVISESRVIDPSVLTTAQLLREIASLKELLQQQIASIERAVQLSHNDLVRVPTDVQKSVGALEALIDTKLNVIEEKLNTLSLRFIDRIEIIDQRFLSRETDAEKTAVNLKVSIDQSLKAIKDAIRIQQEASDKAVGKSENSFIKTVDQLSEFLKSTKADQDARLIELKDRLTRIESVAVGKVEMTKDARDSIGVWVGIGGFLIGALSLIGMIASIFIPRI